MRCKWLIGVDEAGRGPLAGPVSVGVVMVPGDFDWDLIPGVNDSKKLSEKKREGIFTRAQELAAVGALWYSVPMPSAKVIDRQGIVPTIYAAITKGLQEVQSRRTVLRENIPYPPPRSRSRLERGGESGFDWNDCFVKLDGSLHAPEYCVHQETIIKGDAQEKVIGLASILAKVTRDRYMIKMGNKVQFAPYDFARHKGYGTLIHRAKIAKYGLSPLHRTTYCRSIKVVV